MKLFLILVSAGFVLTTGACSETKQKDCHTVAEIIAAFKTRAIPRDTSVSALSNTAALRKASNAAVTATGKLNLTVVKDPNLVSTKTKLLSVFWNIKQALDSLARTSTSVGQTAELKSGYHKLLVEARDSLDAACNKKERNRRAARSKKAECGRVQDLLAGLSKDSPNAEEAGRTAEGLKGFSLSNKAVKTEIEAIMGRLLKLKEILTIEKDLALDLRAGGLLLEKHTQKFTETETALTNYCKETS